MINVFVSHFSRNAGIVKLREGSLTVYYTLHTASRVRASRLTLVDHAEVAAGEAGLVPQLAQVAV